MTYAIGKSEDGKVILKDYPDDIMLPFWVSLSKMCADFGIYYDPLRCAYFDTETMRYMDMKRVEDIVNLTPIEEQKFKKRKQTD